MDKIREKIFISYAREDIERAEKIYNDLTHCGLNVWFDKISLLPGQNWRIETEKAIKNSTTFLALLSDKSVNHVGFVQQELKIALKILDLYPESKIFIIPVRLDKCEPTHEKLYDLHWVDLFPESEYESGIRKILSVLKSRQSEFESEKSKEVINESTELSEEIKSNIRFPEKKKQKTWHKIVVIITAIVCLLMVGYFIFNYLIINYPPGPQSNELSPIDVKNLLKKNDFFCKEYDSTKVFCNPDGKGLDNNYFLQKDGKVVYDLKTALMWQLIKIPYYMNFQSAKNWIKALNQLDQIGFAGYNDWRLPTLEEAMGLMEPEMNVINTDSLYIDSVFGAKAKRIWTANQVEQIKGEFLEKMWVVDFKNGNCYKFSLYNTNYVRAVRSVQ